MKSLHPAQGPPREEGSEKWEKRGIDHPSLGESGTEAIASIPRIIVSTDRVFPALKQGGRRGQQGDRAARPDGCHPTVSLTTEAARRLTGDGRVLGSPSTLTEMSLGH